MAQKAGKYKISRKEKILYDLDASTINTTGTNLDLSGTFECDGLAETKAGITVTGGALTVTGQTAAFGAAATVGTTLAVTGETTLSNHLNIAAGKNIVLTTTGTKIGTAAGQKVGFHGASPVAQQSHIADATDATDVITRANAIIAVLEAYGLTATS